MDGAPKIQRFFVFSAPEGFCVHVQADRLPVVVEHEKATIVSEIQCLYFFNPKQPLTP